LWKKEVLKLFKKIRNYESYVNLTPEKSKIKKRGKKMYNLITVARRSAQMWQTLQPKLRHAPSTFDGRWQVIPQDCILNKERASTSIQTVRWDQIIKQTSGLAKLKLVKQTLGYTTFDYIVDHATNHPMKRHRFCWCKLIWAYNGIKDVSGAWIKGDLEKIQKL
jgi:hypothetical protein